MQDYWRRSHDHAIGAATSTECRTVAYPSCYCTDNWQTVLVAREVNKDHLRLKPLKSCDIPNSSWESIASDRLQWRHLCHRSVVQFENQCIASLDDRSTRRKNQARASNLTVNILVAWPVVAPVHRRSVCTSIKSSATLLLPWIVDRVPPPVPAVLPLHLPAVPGVVHVHPVSECLLINKCVICEIRKATTQSMVCVCVCVCVCVFICMIYPEKSS